MNGFMMVLVVIAMLITLGVLFAGLFSMARGGEFNQKYGNKLMRWRVIMQGVALLLFALAAMAGN
ncbi:twin transmembrane helix small protein [Fodinicurvata fenggangensis]|uniref:twin transmembrane helix small protein n=1 Tax=Fodinicurvata fenggangensis TaxID=1121830 RepID=UPI0004790356|nr:twin transmembrane helix small protein [Fodinicurvata fenggangensis]